MRAAALVIGSIGSLCAWVIFTAPLLSEPMASVPSPDPVVPELDRGARANEDFWNARPFATGLEPPRKRPLAVGLRQSFPKRLLRDGKIVVVAFPQGRLDERITRRVIERRMNEVRRCYEGRVAVRDWPRFEFEIDEHGWVGAVANVGSRIEAPFVERCIRDEIARWKFPPPRPSQLWTYYPFGL